MRIFTNNKVFNQFQFEKEAEFEREIVQNAKLFFGPKSIIIDAKRKIETKTLGNSVPDGFLFDLSDKENPEFYIIEVELARHNFYDHIFPQITKFFGFYKNQKNQGELVEKIFTFINNDEELRKEFKKYLGEREVYKFLKDTVEQSQNILLILDDEKKELPEIMDTYSETWGKMVKLTFIKKFVHQDEVIYSMDPEFENIEFADIDKEKDLPSDGDSLETEYTEAYHLEGVSENVREVYNELRAHVIGVRPDIIINPKKYYISIRKERNIAFFLFSKKKMRLVVMQSEAQTRAEVKHHTLKILTPKVQKFWNGPSCAIILDKPENLNEIKSILTNLINKLA
jgi:predicted transport protein